MSDAEVNPALEAKREHLMAGLGTALAAWGLVEIQLSFIYVSAANQSLEPDSNSAKLYCEMAIEERIAHASINAIISFPARVKMISDVITESLDVGDLTQIWPYLAKKCKAKYEKRHQLGHFLITHTYDKDGSVTPWVTPFANTIGSSRDLRLRRADLDQRASNFLQLGEALHWYQQSIEVVRGRRLKAAEPEPQLILAARLAVEGQSPKEPRLSSGK